MALVNARSICNKTFILNDFFTGRNLDILFLTETWAGVGKLSVFEELCPSNCSFISTPRSVGRGGGVAMVFKQSLKINTVSVRSYSSFEIQCVTLQSASFVLFCGLIYRPPNLGGGFVNDFSDFLTSVVPLYDCMLLLGDFNVHVCCPGRPLVAEFCNVLDSFGFIQHMNQPTHVLGHTLDLIMSYGTPVDNVCIENHSFSDHKPIVFTIPVVSSVAVNKSVGSYSRFINSLTASQFSEKYLANAVEGLIMNAESSSGPD